jgi:hypothetical protein
MIVLFQTNNAIYNSLTKVDFFVIDVNVFNKVGNIITKVSGLEKTPINAITH